MNRQAPAQKLTIYVGEQDHWQGKSLYAALVTRLKAAGVVGVTVLHGIEGYGTSGRLHTERFEVMFQGLPILVEVVDTPEHIASILPLLDEMLTEALVTVQDVTAIHYSKG